MRSRSRYDADLDPGIFQYRYGPRPRIGPYPPRIRGKWKGQLVWPRDKKQKGVHSWSRIKDLLTNKGPDMWIGRQGEFGPDRTLWSGWRDRTYPYMESWDNLGYGQCMDEVLPLKQAYRPPYQRYDFRTRKYRNIEKPGNHRMWTDVKWSNTKPREALYHRDRFGREYVDPEFHDTFEHRYNVGVHNPFAYNGYKPWWDWDIGRDY